MRGILEQNARKTVHDGEEVMGGHKLLVVGQLHKQLSGAFDVREHHLDEFKRWFCGAPGQAVPPNIFATTCARPHSLPGHFGTAVLLENNSFHGNPVAERARLRVRCPIQLRHTAAKFSPNVQRFAGLCFQFILEFRNDVLERAVTHLFCMIMRLLVTAIANSHSSFHIKPVIVRKIEFLFCASKSCKETQRRGPQGALFRVDVPEAVRQQGSACGLLICLTIS